MSLVHVTVLDVVAVLPQASRTVNVLVCDLEQPALPTDPSVDVKVVAPHPSVADAEPSAAEISPAIGLQPRANVVPPEVIIGGALSSVHVTVRETVDVFPQASMAVNVRVNDRPQLVL